MQSEDSELNSQNILLTFVPVLIPVHFPKGRENVVFSYHVWNSIMIVGVLLSAAIKQRMEKDVDEVGKVARSIKSKIEELDREVRARTTPGYSGVVQHLPNDFLVFLPTFWSRI